MNMELPKDLPQSLDAPPSLTPDYKKSCYTYVSSVWQIYMLKKKFIWAQLGIDTQASTANLHWQEKHRSNSWYWSVVRSISLYQVGIQKSCNRFRSFWEILPHQMAKGKSCTMLHKIVSTDLSKYTNCLLKYIIVTHPEVLQSLYNRANVKMYCYILWLIKYIYRWPYMQGYSQESALVSALVWLVADDWNFSQPSLFYCPLDYNQSRQVT